MNCPIWTSLFNLSWLAPGRMPFEWLFLSFSPHSPQELTKTNAVLFPHRPQVIFFFFFLCLGPQKEERRKAGKPTSTVEATVYGCIDWPLYKARGKGGEWSRSPGHTPPVQMCAPAWGRVHAGEGWTQSPVSANTGLSNITSFLLLLFVFSSLSP